MQEVILAFLNPAVIWVLIPVTAIVGGIYADIRGKELKAKIASGNFSNEDKEQIKQVLVKNKELTERVEILEAIITSMDKEILALKASDNPNENQEKVKALSNKMKNN